MLQTIKNAGAAFAHGLRGQPGLPVRRYSASKAISAVRVNIANSNQRRLTENEFALDGSDLTMGGLISDGSLVSEYKDKVGDLRNSSAVMATVQYIIRNWLMAPFILYQPIADGEMEPVRKHPFLSLLRKPSIDETYMPFMQATLEDWFLNGNAFWEKVRNAFGQVVGLTYHAYRMVDVEWGFNPILNARVRMYFVGDDRRPVTMRDMVHLRFSIDPKNTAIGLSPLNSLYREIWIDEESAQFAADILVNKGVTGMIMFPESPEAEIDLGAGRVMKQQVQQQFTGRNRGEPMVLSSRVGVKSLAIEPHQMLLPEHRIGAESRIAAVAGIAPAVTNLLSGMKQVKDGSTMLQHRRSAWEDTIMSYQAMIAEGVWDQLLVDFVGEFALEDWRLGYDLSRIPQLQQNSKEKAEEWQIRLMSGQNLVAEARRAFGDEVIPEDERFFAGVNLETLSRTGEREEKEEPDTGGGFPAGPSDPPNNVQSNQEDEPVFNPEVVRRARDGESGIEHTDPIAQAENFTRWNIQHSEAIEDGIARDFESDLLQAGEDGAEIFRDVVKSDQWQKIQQEETAIEELRKLAEKEVSDNAHLPQGERPTIIQTRFSKSLSEDREFNKLIGAIYLRYSTNLITHIEALSKTMQGSYKRIAGDTVDGLNDQYNRRLSLDKRATERLSRRAITRVTRMNVQDEALERVSLELQLQARRFASIEDAADVIESKITAGRFNDVKTRARLIARTEIIKAKNYTSIDASRGKRQFKGMRCSDGRVPSTSDATCLARNGQLYDARHATRLTEEEHPNGTMLMAPIFEDLTTDELSRFIGRVGTRV